MANSDFLAETFVFWTDFVFVDKNSQGRWAMSIVKFAAAQCGMLRHLEEPGFAW
jgi:hypothetical protein